MPPRRFFFFGFQGVGNLGDELMAQALISSLEERFGKCIFRLRSWTIAAHYPSVTYTGIEQLLSGESNRLIKATRYLHALNKEVRACQVVIFPGGTIFLGTGENPWNLPFKFALSLLARVHRRPLIAVGVGVRDFSRWIDIWLMKRILNACVFVSVRDNVSFRVCDGLGSRTDLTASPDITFTLPVYADKSREASRNRVVLCLSAAQMSDLRQFQEHLNSALTALRLEVSPGEHFSCLLFQVTPDPACGPGDIAAYELVFGPDFKHTCEIMAQEDALRCIASAKLVVGGRYHALVLAAMTGVPFVALGDSVKIRTIAQQSSMPFLAYREVSASSLLEAAADARGRGIPSAALRTLRADARRGLDQALERLS